MHCPLRRARVARSFAQAFERYGAERAVGCDLLFSRYDKVAEALGGHGEYVEDPDELTPALRRAVESGLPACVNVIIDGVAAPVSQLRDH